MNTSVTKNPNCSPGSGLVQPTSTATRNMFGGIAQLTPAQLSVLTPEQIQVGTNLNTLEIA